MAETVRKLRAHHIRNMYFNFIRNGKLPNFRIGKIPTEYTVLVTDRADYECKIFCGYPVMNFCSGPKIRKLDKKSAKILDIRIGKYYTKEELRRIFTEKVINHGLEIGRFYSWDELMAHFTNHRYQ